MARISLLGCAIVNKIPREGQNGGVLLLCEEGVYKFLICGALRGLEESEGENMVKSFLFLLLLLLSRAVFAQPLAGTWVSNQLILAAVRFSLTFRSDMTYQIDTVLGRTIGTYTFTDDSITFTPTKVGINGGMVGDNDVYSYAFHGENTLYLKSKGSEVELTRVKSS